MSIDIESALERKISCFAKDIIKNKFFIRTTNQLI